MHAIIVLNSNYMWLFVGVVVFFLGLLGFGLNYNLRRNRASAEKDAEELRREVRRLSSAQSGESLSEADLRQKALEAALATNPHLADAKDSESFRELQGIVDDITEQMQLRQRVDDLKAKQDAERAQEEAVREIATQREAARLQRERHDESLRLQKEEEVEAAAAARRDRLAAMSPPRRWIAANARLSVGIAGVVVSVFLGGAYLIVSKEIERRQSAETAAQSQAQVEAEAAEREVTLRSCALGQVRRYAGAADVMNAWATCDSAAMRLAVVKTASDGTLSTESLTALAGDADVYVREGVARRASLPAGVQRLLASDPYTQVRSALANRADLPPEIQTLLLSDPDLQVRSVLANRPDLAPGIQERLSSDGSREVRLRVAQNEFVDSQILGKLLADAVEEVRYAAANNRETLINDLRKWADDPNERFREAVRSRIYVGLCEAGVQPRQSLVGTTWQSEAGVFTLREDCEVRGVFSRHTWSYDGRILVLEPPGFGQSRSFELLDGRFVQGRGSGSPTIWTRT